MPLLTLTVDMDGSANPYARTNVVCSRMLRYESPALTKAYGTSVCGACKIGKLVPQFAEKAPKTPKSKVASRMAPEKTQGKSFSLESSAIHLNYRRVAMRCTSATCHVSLLAYTWHQYFSPDSRPKRQGLLS